MMHSFEYDLWIASSLIEKVSWILGLQLKTCLSLYKKELYVSSFSYQIDVPHKHSNRQKLLIEESSLASVQLCWHRDKSNPWKWKYETY